MTTINNINDLRKELENSGYFGLRMATEHDIDCLEKGYLDCSYNWDDGEMSEESLNGTCALEISEYLSDEEIISRYNSLCEIYSANIHTGRVLLVNDKNHEYGNDENEIILGSNGYGADVIAEIISL